MPVHQFDNPTDLLIFNFPEPSQDCTIAAQKNLPLPVSGKEVIQIGRQIESGAFGTGGFQSQIFIEPDRIIVPAVNDPGLGHRR